MMLYCPRCHMAIATLWANQCPQCRALINVISSITDTTTGPVIVANGYIVIPGEPERTPIPQAFYDALERENL